MTSKYKFDPYFGFTLSKSPINPHFSSLTCYLTFRSKTESLQFMVHSQQLLTSHPSATIPVTLQAGEEVVEGWGEIVVDCKVELDEELEVEWEVPALPFHRF